jgi:hypothetical protein
MNFVGNEGDEIVNAVEKRSDIRLFFKLHVL